MSHFDEYNYGLLSVLQGIHARAHNLQLPTGSPFAYTPRCVGFQLHPASWMTSSCVLQWCPPPRSALQSDRGWGYPVVSEIKKNITWEICNFRLPMWRSEAWFRTMPIWCHKWHIQYTYAFCQFSILCSN